MGLRDQIVAAQDRNFVDEAVPEWDCIVRVQAMTGKDLASFYNEVGTSKGKEFEITDKSFMAKLLIRSLTDPETGERLFADNEAPVVEAKSGAVTVRLFRLAQDVNGMSPESVEKIEKN